MKHLGTQKLATDRLLLRPFQEGDAQAIFDNWASDDEVTRYLLWFTHQDMQDTEDALASWVKKYERPDYYHWAIVPKELGEPIGSLTLFDIKPCFFLPFKYRAEVGYCIGRSWWKQGIAQEAVTAILDFAFVHLNMQQVVARHDHRNPASGQVMQRLRMTHTHFRRRAERGRDGKWIDCDYYRLTRQDNFKGALAPLPEKARLFNKAPRSNFR